MQLEKIEMTGFKSFADKTVIEFDKGVTAVVGPNGSGKSNLSEAIKWVLGEQSAKSLRGQKMDDVIFAGSQTRKPVNIAEVQLYITNDDQKLAIDQKEVVLTRRLNRNGTSDFFINKKACRLKDITNLMMDSGLGKDSFALISQGKVEQIFNDKPEERRMIIEEAAGVLKYKERKSQAERKLKQTQEYLNRVEDILHEIKGQLEPLAIQKEKAIIYLAKKSELQDIETALLAVEIETLNTQWTVTKKEVAQLQSEVKQIEESVEELQVFLSNSQTSLTEKNHQLDSYQQDYVAKIQQMEQLEGDRKVYLQKQDFAKKSDAENQLSLQATVRELEQIEESIQTLEKEVWAKKTEQKLIEEKWQNLVLELEQLSQGNEEARQMLQNQYIEQVQEVSRLTNQGKNLERSKQQNQYASDRMIEKQALTRQQFESLSSKEITLNEQTTHIQSQLQLSTQQLLTTQQHLETAKAEVEKSIEQKQKIERQLQQTQATHRSLKQISEDYAGYYQGVREVLKRKQQLQGVIGSVAELIRVEEAYTLAIDVALGASTQHIVVQDERAAAQAIDYLKKHRLGRATFLPITIIRAKQFSSDLLQKAQSTEGFVGIASDLVQVSHEYQMIIKNILGTTLVTKTLKDAIQLAKILQYRYRIVTLEGDVSNAGGSMTGGASKNHQQQSLVQRTSQLEALEVQLKQLQQFYQKNEQIVADRTKQLTLLREEEQKVQKEFQVLQQQEQEVRLQLTYVQDELQKMKRQQQAEDYELSELKQEAQQLEKDYLDNQQQLHQLLQKSEQAKQELELLQLSQEERTKKIQERQTQLQKVGTDKARIEEQATQVQREAHKQKQAKKKLEEHIRFLTAKQDEQAQEQEQQKATFKEIEKLYEQVTKHVTELEEAIAHLKEERMKLEIETKQTEASRNHAQQQLQEKLKQQSKIETKANRFEMAIDQKLTYLSEEYELTFEAAVAKTELKLSIEEASKTVRQLKQQIEQMGAVNVMAIDEHDAIQQRFAFLEEQQSDLLEAKKNLEDTITEMDEEVTNRFKQTFEAISSQFQRTFPRLFGGGRASLELSNPDNLLETGIDIIAQPPGKKLQSLSLLSGGERAFTAIALLFAILEVKPVPFCLLDEVEAALDEANVARYGRYLKEFTNRTQFIVITHRRGTMEEADVLYGVTMQESGVSKLASVKFEDFEE